MVKILFVYGTLMKGHCNDHYLREQKYIGIGKLKNYEMFHVDVYPGIVERKGEVVVGELYEIDSELLKKLDVVECEGDLFIRKEVEVLLDCKTISTEVYVWNKPIDAKVQKVVEMPWQPLENVPCRVDFKKLNSENPFDDAKWPMIIKNEKNEYFEACTIRGAVASLIGKEYLENQKDDTDWQMRLKFAFEEVLSKQHVSHVIIKDRNKGVVAENVILEDVNSISPTEFVHIESERAFLFSLVILKKVVIYEREGERYLREWIEDGNDHTLSKEISKKKYIDISSYPLEELIKQTWEES